MSEPLNMTYEEIAEKVSGMEIWLCKICHDNLDRDLPGRFLDEIRNIAMQSSEMPLADVLKKMKLKESIPDGTIVLWAMAFRYIRSTL